MRAIATTFVLAPLLALALAGCQKQAEQARDAEEQAAIDNTSPTKETVELAGGGLIVPAQGGDDQMEVPFGSVREAAETTLATVLGKVLERGENKECSAGFMAFTKYEGLVLYFQDGKLVGWYSDGTYLPTEMRSELEATGQIHMVEGSTLGQEFTFGLEGGPMISGLFGSEGDDARVSNLWAGTTCIAR